MNMDGAVLSEVVQLAPVTSSTAALSLMGINIWTNIDLGLRHDLYGSLGIATTAVLLNQIHRWLINT